MFTNTLIIYELLLENEECLVWKTFCCLKENYFDMIKGGTIIISNLIILRVCTCIFGIKSPGEKFFFYRRCKMWNLKNFEFNLHSKSRRRFKSSTDIFYFLCWDDLVLGPLNLWIKSLFGKDIYCPVLGAWNFFLQYLIPLQLIQSTDDVKKSENETLAALA